MIATDQARRLLIEEIMVLIGRSMHDPKLFRRWLARQSLDELGRICDRLLDGETVAQYEARIRDEVNL